MKSHLSMITLGVKDFGKSRKFYEALGFKCEGEDTEGYVVFKTDGTRLSLQPIEELAKEVGVPIPEGDNKLGITIAHCEPSKEDVDRVMEEVRKAGANITKEAEDTFWGGYSGHFTDPDGYHWEIAWNAFTDMT